MEKTAFLRDKFEEKFNHQADLMVQSPGRLNIIGEHTDYNNGWVLPAAINKEISLLIKKTNGNIIRIYALDIEEYLEFDFNNINQFSSWEVYPVGIIELIKEQYGKMVGFDALFSSTIPQGGGMSSSAAIETAFVFALNHILELEIPREKMAKIAQLAEQRFSGVQCGIMDQFASLMGKKNQAILLDCRDLSYSYFPVDLKNYSFLLCNTNIKHSLADSAYNTRRQECEEGVTIIKKEHKNIQSLRDVSLSLLLKYKNQLSNIVYQRCEFVIQENLRVEKAVKALQEGDLKLLGELMYTSHDGLSTQYEVSCPELDFFVEIAKKHPQILGCRMMGGGFGGCTIQIIEKDFINEFIPILNMNYKNNFDKEMTAYIVNINDGVRISSNF